MRDAAPDASNRYEPLFNPLCETIAVLKGDKFEQMQIKRK
jgi:hypothetical protein